MSFKNASKRLEVRLEKARVLDAHIATLKKFQKSEPDAIATMQAQFQKCLTIWESMASVEAKKEKEVSLRQEEYYYSDVENLMLKLTDINRYLMGKRNIPKATKQSIAKIIRSIRGTRKTKKKQPTDNLGTLAANTAKQQDTFYYKNSHGFGNKLANFKQIIVILAELGPLYAPGSKVIQIVSLQQFYERLELKNRLVNGKKNEFTILQEDSGTEGKLLMLYCKDVKNLIQSEFRSKSNEFAPISHIRFV